MHEPSAIRWLLVVLLAAAFILAAWGFGLIG
jgi:hypothetical protein